MRAIEEETIRDLEPLVRAISNVTLSELEEAIREFGPCPGSPELLGYFRRNGKLLSALLGEGGDPAFAEKLKEMVGEAVRDRALDGFAPLALAGFDYYLTFAISAEVGVLIRWLTTGMVEPDDVMARIMTALMFIRPGDLYGRPIEFDLPSFPVVATGTEKEPHHG